MLWFSASVTAVLADGLDGVVEAGLGRSLLRCVACPRGVAAFPRGVVVLGVFDVRRALLARGLLGVCASGREDTVPRVMSAAAIATAAAAAAPLGALHRGVVGGARRAMC